MKRFGLVVLLAIGCIAAHPAPLTPGKSGIWEGYIVEGERFGIQIGDSREQALTALKARGYKARDYGDPCDEYYMSLADCSAMESLIRVRVVRLGWDGRIHIGFRDGRVVAIIWRGTLRPYLDS